jgi:hypothetical protein
MECKRKVTPVTIGATGTIRKYLSSIPGKHDIKEYRKQLYWAQHTYCGKC